MSNYQSDTVIGLKPKKKLVDEQGVSIKRSAEEPMFLRSKLRNKAINEAYFATSYRTEVDEEASQLRNELRKHSNEDRIRSHKSELLRMAREKPEDFVDQVVKTKPAVDYYTSKPGIAALNKKYLSHFFSGEGVGSFEHPEPAGVGEMWWGESFTTLPDRLGMHTIFTDEGLLIFGNLSWDNADLYQTGLHVFSSFFLDVRRMPQVNRVRSSPGGVLTGQMFGFTSGLPGLLGITQGDRWSKCRLKLHQRAFAINPNNPVDVIPAAASTLNEFQIIDVSEVNDFQETNLPGGLAYAPMDIQLIKNRILRIDLEIDFNIALEGDAGIRFGGIGHANPAFHQPTQWILQPL